MYTGSTRMCRVAVLALLVLFTAVSAQSGQEPNEPRDVRDPDKLRRAADGCRLQSQSGSRERFATGIQISRRYLKEMEEIFRSEGLPVELTRLPLVESCFNVRAYSKAAAAGIWQFIP